MPDRPPLRVVESPPPGWPEWMENWVIPYVREPALWPVLLALLGHVVVALVPMMLATVRDQAGWAILGLLALSALSAWLVGFEVRRFHRPRGVTLAVVSTWLVSVGLAWLADRTGTF